MFITENVTMETCVQIRNLQLINCQCHIKIQKSITSTEVVSYIFVSNYAIFGHFFCIKTL